MSLELRACSHKTAELKEFAAAGLHGEQYGVSFATRRELITNGIRRGGIIDHLAVFEGMDTAQEIFSHAFIYGRAFPRFKHVASALVKHPYNSSSTVDYKEGIDTEEFLFSGPLCRNSKYARELRKRGDNPDRRRVSSTLQEFVDKIYFRTGKIILAQPQRVKVTTHGRYSIEPITGFRPVQFYVVEGLKSVPADMKGFLEGLNSYWKA